MLKEHGEDVAEEKWLPMEGCFVLKAKRPGVSARALAKQYGLEERRPYLNRSRSDVDQSAGLAVRLIPRSPDEPSADGNMARSDAP